MGWQDAPQAGESFTLGRETRTVSDRSFGGDVLYYTGSRRRRHFQVTEATWIEWCAKAQCVECGGTPGLVWAHYQFCSRAPRAEPEETLDDSAPTA